MGRDLVGVDTLPDLRRGRRVHTNYEASHRRVDERLHGPRRARMVRFAPADEAASRRHLDYDRFTLDDQAQSHGDRFGEVCRAGEGFDVPDSVVTHCYLLSDGLSGP
jgi:hypothetical protein